MLKFYMGLFEKIKRIFKKVISISEKQKDELLSSANLKDNILKFGSEIKVEKGYCLAFCFFNKVCEILPEGVYKVEQNLIPRLFAKYCKWIKNKEGKSFNKIENVDAYFVNMEKIFKLSFKTNRLRCVFNEKKLKVKLQIDFEYKIGDVEKFMRYFCDEYAFLKNKTILSDLKEIFKIKLFDYFCKNQVFFEDLYLDRQHFCVVLKEELTKECSKFGVELLNCEILNVFTSKKDVGKKIYMEGKLKNQQQIINIAENQINNVDGKQVVEVFSVEDGAKHEEQASENRKFASKENFDSEIIIIDDNMQNQELNEQFFVDSYDFGKTEQQEPKLFVSEIQTVASQQINQNTEQNNKNDTNSVDDNKKLTDEEKLSKKFVRCQSCGAQNRVGDGICCVCKSKI